MIQGVGIPSKIKSAGTIYKDKITGRKYKQNVFPYGNVWTPIETNVEDNVSIVQELNKVYTLKVELSYSDIINSSSSAIELGEINVINNLDCIVEILDINSRFEGTNFTRSGPELYVKDIDENNEIFSIQSSIALTQVQSGFFSNQWLGNYIKKITPTSSLQLGLIEDINLGAGDVASGGGDNSVLIVYITYSVNNL